MIAIAAVGASGVLGIKGRLPWHLPEDLAFFRETTMGHIVLMGRKTFESLAQPLEGRENWVLTRNPATPLPSCVRRINDPAQIIEPSDGRKIFLAGGAQIYAALLPSCSEMLLTHIYGDFSGDVFFPPYQTLFYPSEIIHEDASRSIVRHLHR